MRIQIQPSSDLNKNDLKRLDKLKKGDMIRGKIVEVNGDVAKIELGNGEIAYGKLEVPLKLLKDKVLNFVIKEMKENILFLSPKYEDIDFNKEFILKNKDLIMDRILNLSKMTKDETNLNIIKNMIKFRMPLDNHNIQSITKHVDKLISMLNLQEDEIVQILSNIEEPMDEDINKFIKLKNETNQTMDNPINKKTDQMKNITYNKNLNDNNVNRSDFIEFKSENIVTDVELKDDYLKLEDVIKQFSEEEGGGFKNITKQVKQGIKSIFSDKNTIEDIIQKVVFLNKSNINLTMNNLKRLTRLVNNGETLNKDLEQVINLSLQENIIDEKTKDDILNKTRNVELKFDENDSQRIKEFNKELSDITNKILSSISSKEEVSKELTLKTKELSEDINFLNKVNDKSTLMLIPFSLNNKQLENNLYILSKRKVVKKSDNIKVYMCLNTKNFTNIKVLCDFTYGSLSVNFKVKEEYIKLFDENKNDLKNILKTKGYENIYIYVSQEKEEKVLDLLSYEDDINYMLNVKV